MKNWLRKFVLPPLVFGLYWLLYKSWKIEFIESEELKKCRAQGFGYVMVHWHGDDFALVHLVRRYNLALMTSKSSDGSLAEYMVRRMGGETSKGSSSRAAVSGLLGLIRICKTQNRPVSFAVDGPRGPLHVVKAGALEFAKLTGFPIFPVSADADRKWTQTRSWNQAFLPKPLARVVIVVGNNCLANSKIEPKSPDQRARVAEALHNAKQHAAKRIAEKNSQC